MPGTGGKTWAKGGGSGATSSKRESNWSWRHVLQSRHTLAGSARNLFGIAPMHSDADARVGNRMRVLHVTCPGEVGGLERVVQILAAAQQAAGHEVHVAAFVGGVTAGTADRFSAPLRAAGVAVHTFTILGRAYLRERSAVVKLANRYRIELIHTHGYRADVVAGGVAGRLGSVAAVTTVHGFTGGGFRNRCYEWLQRRAFRGFDAVIGVSQPLVDRLRQSGIPPQRIHMVKNCWQPSAPRLDRTSARLALGVRDDVFVIGWVGRMSHEKGPDVLLDALDHLTDLPLCVQFLGDGPERAMLEERSHARWGTTRVVWRGTVMDADRLFSGFDVFINSSRTEGTPMVLFEAMAAGVPIVATRVGGVPDMLAPDEAWLVPPSGPAALAAAVREVVLNPGEAAIRARAACRRLQRECDISEWASAYTMAYESAISVARRRQ